MRIISKQCSPAQHLDATDVDLAAIRGGALGAHSLTLRRMCLAQRRVEQLVLEGKNVFFTGNAGTGKLLHP